MDINNIVERAKNIAFENGDTCFLIDDTFFTIERREYVMMLAPKYIFSCEGVKINVDVDICKLYFALKRENKERTVRFFKDQRTSLQKDMDSHIAETKSEAIKILEGK